MYKKEIAANVQEKKMGKTLGYKLLKKQEMQWQQK